MDQLACINAFISIVEHGSLHAAALKLHQTDAAISKKLSKLEASLSVILLERGHGKLKLTDVGQQYYTICKEATDKIATANELIQDATAVPKGELKVCCARYIAHRDILPKLQGFLTQYPGIKLTLNVSERIPSFAKGEVDILFGVAMPIPDQDENLVRKKMGQTRHILCASPEYLKTAGIPQKPKDVIQLQFLCHSAQRPANLFTFDDDTEIQTLPFLKFDDHETLIHAALQDLGFIFTREFMVTEHLQSGRLVELLPKYQKTQLPIYTYYRHQAYPDPKVRAFIEYFTTSCGSALSQRPGRLKTQS